MIEIIGKKVWSHVNSIGIKDFLKQYMFYIILVSQFYDVIIENYMNKGEY